MMAEWTKPVVDPSEELLMAWAKALERAEAKGFQPLVDWASLPDADRVRLESHRFTQRFLQPDFDPYTTPAKVERSVHRATGDTPDVLRHRFSVSSLKAADRPARELALVVTETTDYVRIDVGETGPGFAVLPPPARAAAIGELAALVLKMQGTRLGRDHTPAAYAFTFLHGPLEEGARFSTAPGVDIRMMWSWADRLDGGIQKGKLYFLGFKKYEPTNGRLIMLDAQHWFDGQCWKAFAP